MSKKQELILMYQDEEVLSFLLDLDNSKVKMLDKLEGFDKAPYGMYGEEDEGELNRILYKFFNGRTLAETRHDYDNISKAVGCKDSFELSFRGHGLSLSNHYWYRREDENLKYKDINFFTNKWDDSFARAVLTEDYDALSKCDLNVPDIVTDGWAVKGWLCEDVPKLYKLGITKGHSEDSIAEVLSSRLACRMFDESEVLKYELATIGGQYASVSASMLGLDEEMVPLSDILPIDVWELYFGKNRDKSMGAEFFRRVSEIGIPDLEDRFVKLFCLRCLCFVSDLHFDNISVIRHIPTGNIRMAPIYDLAGAFASSQGARDFLSTVNQATLMIVYFLYRGLEKDWDYSWYNPDSLIGFEDEIREYLSKSDFYTPDLIDNIIEVYNEQKKYLNEIACV